MDVALARTVLLHRPVWAVSTLAAPKRTPPIPGLFDVVIFDEAGQCDIASAMPLLARSRRAVVVGDPAQLSVIQAIGVAADRELIRALGVGGGAYRFAQSLGSLFDLAAASPCAERRFLGDQFRSDPDIVGYLNDAFYGRRLRPRVDRAALRVPPGARPGLVWCDACGPLVTDGGRGCASTAEADAIVERLAALAETCWEGSVGVIAPFNQQVARIERAALNRLPQADRERLRLRIATVDRFQGAERDLILFSLCGGSDAPPGARRFLASDRRRFNVAISRARAVCEIVGDLDWARASGIDHVERLARRAAGEGPAADAPRESPWEERLFAAMRSRGLEPRPQYEIAGARLDFALFRGEVRLDVEVDGRTWHLDADGRRKATDLWRDHKLRALGWRVRRFWVFELRDDMEKCLDLIDADLRG
jgi:very-short-patch-repair endonuclease